jgi:hypothetical protein
MSEHKAPQPGTPPRPAKPDERKLPREPPQVGSHEHVEQALDEALAASFPASDPVSIATSQHEEARQKN